MKVCKNCGFQTTDDSATICDSCGGDLTKDVYKNPPVYKSTKSSSRKSYAESEFKQFNFEKDAQNDNGNYYRYPRYDEGGIGWILLGLLISPLLALILYLILKADYPNRASDIKKGAIIGIVVCVVILIFSSCWIDLLLSRYPYR